MRVFVTGATGFIGSAVVAELKAAGHDVLGLARNEEGAAKVEQLGAQVHRGDLTDIDSLVAGARACDGVAHLAFIHDFSNIAASGVVDKQAIEAIGAALAGSGRPFVVTSGLASYVPGQVSTEDTKPDPNKPISHRVPSEIATLELASQGVRSSIVGFPPSVHGKGDKGFIPMIINVAREKGVSAYIGDGANRWPAVHRLDAAHLFRLALEKGVAGTRYHGVGDEGIPTREIAEVIGRRLNLPVVSLSREEAAEHFGWIANFFGLDASASSALTQQRLDWHPTHPGLLADMQENYF